MEQNQTGKTDEIRLPIEFRTVLKALRLKILWLLGIGVIAIAAGVAAALMFGSQNYRATTVLYYEPIQSFITDTFQVYQVVGEATELRYEQGAGLLKLSSSDRSLVNHINLVKTLPNLETLRERLGISRSLEQLGSAISVSAPGNANLMTISAQAPLAEDAMRIANGIRDVFLERSDALVAESIAEIVLGLEAQLDVARSTLVDAQQEFSEFITTERIRETGTELREAAEDLLDLEKFLPETEKLVESLGRQLEVINAVNLSNFPTISDYAQLIFSRRIDIQLKLIEAEGYLETLQDRYAYLLDRYERLPEIAQKFRILAGARAALEAEVKGLEKLLGQFLDLSGKTYSDFSIVSDAVLPLYPQESNRKLLAIAGTGAVFILGFMVLLLTIILDTRIKSIGDAAQKLQMPVLAEFPYEPDPQLRIPGWYADGEPAESSHLERYRILARPLRALYRERTVVYLITSAAGGEGKSTIALNLAAVFGRQDERVLLVDAHVRATPELSPFHGYRIPPGNDEPEEVHSGLGEYLSYQAFDVEEIIAPTLLPGVDMIAGLHSAVVPDMLQSVRMQELMEELIARYSIILIEGPPVEASVDSEIIAQYADTVIVAVACGYLVPDRIRRALKRLELAEAPIEGIILTKVLAPYVT